MRPVIAGMILLSSACGTPEPEQEEITPAPFDIEQELVTAEVTLDIGPAPRVRWFEGEELTYSGFWIPDEGHPTGMFLHGVCYVEIHMSTGAVEFGRFHEMLAHELCHWEAFELRDGGSNDDHGTQEFDDCTARLDRAWFEADL